MLRCSFSQENWKREQEEQIESKRRGIDREEATLQRKLRAETIQQANDKLYEQTGKMKLLRSNLLYAEVIEVCIFCFVSPFLCDIVAARLRPTTHLRMARETRS